MALVDYVNDEIIRWCMNVLTYGDITNLTISFKKPTFNETCKTRGIEWVLWVKDLEHWSWFDKKERDDEIKLCILFLIVYPSTMS